MSVSFALSLSSQGIDLLERVPLGWSLVGSAQVQADDLPSQLATLRQIAWLLAPQGFVTKLVIPADQIRYITLAGEVTNIFDIQRVLEDATPYLMRDLAVDYGHHAGQTYLAAIAKDTLQEAEGFARAYGFNPACFVARPAHAVMGRELTFGLTNFAKTSGIKPSPPDHLPPPAISDSARAQIKSLAGYRVRIDPVIAAYDANAVPIAPARPSAPQPAPRPDWRARWRPIAQTITAAAQARTGARVIAQAARQSPRRAAAAAGAAIAALALGAVVALWPAPPPAPTQTATAPDRTPVAAITLPLVTERRAPQIWQALPALPARDLAQTDQTPPDLLVRASAAQPVADQVPPTLAPLADDAPPSAPAAPDVTSDSADPDISVIVGRPAVVPPPRPLRAPAPEAQTDAPDAPPDDTATAGGVALSALQGATTLNPIRPRPRPQRATGVDDDQITAVLGGIALAEPDPLATATARAVTQSVRPQLRPRNFDRVVAAARARQTAPTPAPAAAPSPQSVAAAPAAPRTGGPVPSDVALAATQDGALALRQMNLVGVFGSQNARRALVRLSNGQFLRVEVGSELDGGQVTAIGDRALNYVKGGQTLALQLP